MNSKIKNRWVFFGTSEFSVIILEKLKQAGLLPSLIVTVPDKPKGRKLVLTPPEVKVWAKKEKIPCIQPQTLKDQSVVDEINSYGPDGFDFFVVASYGKIIPQAILDIPKLGTLNVHPSMLPKFRGASPIQNAILFDNETGVTIMRLDAEMDHGPIVSQKKLVSWEESDVPYEKDLEKELGEKGGGLLASILPDWQDGKIAETEQDHTKATVCGKIEKKDGLLDFADLASKNLRKIRAYQKWPGAYYFYDKNGKQTRVIVKKAHLENGLLVIDRVIPEGKKEMDYAVFARGEKL